MIVSMDPNPPRRNEPLRMSVQMNALPVPVAGHCRVTCQISRDGDALVASYCQAEWDGRDRVIVYLAPFEMDAETVVILLTAFMEDQLYVLRPLGDIPLPQRGNWKIRPASTRQGSGEGDVLPVGVGPAGIPLRRIKL